MMMMMMHDLLAGWCCFDTRYAGQIFEEEGEVL
jgi:hypothetical protein